MKYQNVIFDFGNVLVKVSSEYMVSRFTDNEDDIKLLSDVIFSRDIWDKLDIGTISEEESLAIIKSRLDERLHNIARKVFESWIDLLPEVEGMRELIAKLRNAGCGVYMLSNISKRFSENRHKAPIVSLFDGVVCSGDLGYGKPDRRIFEHICEKYSIDPSTAIFIDDNKMNTDAAKQFGLDAWHFRFDVDDLTNYLFEE